MCYLVDLLNDRKIYKEVIPKDIMKINVKEEQGNKGIKMLLEITKDKNFKEVKKNSTIRELEEMGVFG